MKTPRTKLTISYQVLDESGRLLEVIKETGFNRNNIQWRTERKLKRMYKKPVTLNQIKIEKEES